MSASDLEVQPEALFAALRGRSSHGARFIESARQAGAVAVLTDREGVDIEARNGLPIIVSTDPRRALVPISAQVYGTNRLHPTLFGVTGTNGKTTTVHLLDAILEQLGIRSVYSSTLHRGSGTSVVASRLTSPEASELHALLARMNEDRTEAVAVEVSAQAMTNHRIGGIVFDVAGFTNLGHDHLDEFRSMDDYVAAKTARVPTRTSTAAWRSRCSSQPATTSTRCGGE